MLDAFGMLNTGGKGPETVGLYSKVGEECTGNCVPPLKMMNEV